MHGAGEFKGNQEDSAVLDRMRKSVYSIVSILSYASVKGVSVVSQGQCVSFFPVPGL